MAIWADTSEKRPPKKKEKEGRKERHSNSTVSVSLFRQRLSYFKKVFFFCLCVKGFATLSSTSEEATSPATFPLLPSPLFLFFFPPSPPCCCSLPVQFSDGKKKREPLLSFPLFFSPQRISARSPTEVFCFSLFFSCDWFISLPTLKRTATKQQQQKKKRCSHYITSPCTMRKKRRRKY